MMLPAPLRSSRSRTTRGLAVLALTLTLGATATGCSMFGGSASPSPSATGGATGSATPFGTASPDDSATPGDSVSPTPGDSATPGSTPATPGSETATPGASGTPSAAPVSCTSVTPVRIQKVTADPRRTVEVVTVVSDGRNLTPGTREQGEFGAPTLKAPDGSAITDQSTVTKIADLIEGSSRNTVLLTRPDAPDTGVDASRRPYNAPGTYVAYNASSPLTADVIVQCSGQEQRWQFTAESDLTRGIVNCAVEPPRSNAVARQVYGSNC